MKAYMSDKAREIFKDPKKARRVLDYLIDNIEEIHKKSSKKDTKHFDIKK